MNIVFIRHATADPAGKGGDPARKLTKEGKAEARIVGRALRKMGIDLEAILTSPLVRAVQTGEGIAKSHGKAVMKAYDGLAPGALSADALRRRLGQLANRGISTVALVGHAPSLDECIGELAAGTSEPGLALSKAGAACLQTPSEDSPTGFELRWLMRHEQLKLLLSNDE